MNGKDDEQQSNVWIVERYHRGWKKWVRVTTILGSTILPVDWKRSRMMMKPTEVEDAMRVMHRRHQVFPTATHRLRNVRDGVVVVDAVLGDSNGK